ncbi:hypothetical protein BRADI_1g20055v3 [Brachypodium distachyon]|uniref:KIB1-4 beta-propeller domain-containing protein n=1 Tax=Brachypodium distachyon TaxID=15368 RepID=A0A0Q3GVK3_BRADI|nr:hypothetical protein BRADI_1g20055v3 [Brachypodium distachyon]
MAKSNARCHFDLDNLEEPAIEAVTSNMEIISTMHLATFSKTMFRAIASNRQLPFELPCLLMPDLATWTDYNKNWDKRVVNVVPIDMPPCRANMSFLQDTFWVGGKGDWLATINEAGNCSLMDVYTRRVIDLPSIETAQILRSGPSHLPEIVPCSNENVWRLLRNCFIGVPHYSDAIEHKGIIFVVDADDGSILYWDHTNKGEISLPVKIPPPLEEQRAGLWFLACSTNEEHLMIIRTYGSPTGGEANIPYLGRTIRECARFGCHVFERNPSSIQPGVSTWSRVHTLGTHSLFIGINYPMNLHIRDRRDRDGNTFPFMRRNCIYTSYHGFRVDHRSPEIRRFGMQQEEGQFAPGIKLPSPGWFSRQAATWFKPSLNNIQTWAHI